MMADMWNWKGKKANKNPLIFSCCYPDCISDTMQKLELKVMYNINMVTFSKIVHFCYLSVM